MPPSLKRLLFALQVSITSGSTQLQHTNRNNVFKYRNILLCYCNVVLIVVVVAIKYRAKSMELNAWIDSCLDNLPYRQAVTFLSYLNRFNSWEGSFINSFVPLALWLILISFLHSIYADAFAYCLYTRFGSAKYNASVLTYIYRLAMVSLTNLKAFMQCRL